MAFNFPDSPTAGQIFTDTASGAQYVYTNGVWMQSSAAQIKLSAQARSRVVNGAMQISQENGSTAVAMTGLLPADQWYGYANGPTATIERLTSFVSPQGSTTMLAVTITVAKPSLAAGDVLQVYQVIEGIRVRDFGWGTAQARQVVLRFTARANVAGTYCVSIRNGAVDRSWIGNFNIPTAGVDTTITMVIPGDTTGTWPKDNTLGLYVTFQFACGTTYQGVAGWQAGDKRGIAGMTNAASATGIICISDVGLYLDDQATGAAPPWVMPDEAQELAACQRYYVKTSGTSIILGGWSGAIGATVYSTLSYPVPMRIAPAIAFTQSGNNAASAGLAMTGVVPEALRYQVAATNSAVTFYAYGSWAANARM